MLHSGLKCSFLVYVKGPTSDLDTDLTGLCFCGQLCILSGNYFLEHPEHASALMWGSLVYI